jgi:hypothetical protein
VSKKLDLPLKVDGFQHGYCVFKSGSVEFVVKSVAEDAPEEDRALVGSFTGLSFAGYRRSRFGAASWRRSKIPSGNALQIVQLPAAAP